MNMVLSFLILLLSILTACAQVPRAPAQSEKLYESQRITAKSLFTRGIEGPAVDRNDNLYVVNFGKDGTIGIISSGKEPALWLTLPEGSISNAIRFNAQGEMFAADRKRHRILKIDLSTKEFSVYAENEKLNQPNDFTISKNGELYLSDPSWSSKKVGGVWLAEKNETKMIAGDLRAVNGIDLSPDETKLYFTESIGGGLWVFDLADKKLTNKRLLFQFKKDTVDGLRVDSVGTIYVARITEGKIDRISPDGKLLNSIPTLGKDPTNLAFGGLDGRTVFVTSRDSGSIESFRVPEPGREWHLQR